MSQVIWQNDGALWLLWAIPVIVLAAVYAHKRTRRAARLLVGDVMTRRLMPDLAASGPLVRAGLFVAGYVLVIVALARPCWDYDYVSVEARGVDVVVALDVSRSMLAMDGGETRLDRARSALAELVADLPGDRVGLLLFAGDRVLTCPLTYDRGFFLQALRGASPDAVGRGGTLIGPALTDALEVLDAEHGRDKVCVLITDAGDQDSFPRTVAEDLAQRKVRVIALGIGRSEDPNAPLILDGQVVRRGDGAPVLARVDEELLQGIVERTRGLYVPPEQTHRLRDLYRRYVDPLAKGEAQELQEKQYRERYQWFLFPGILLLLMQALMRNYPRRRATGVAPLAALLCCGVLMGGCSGGDGEDAIRAATAALADGDAQAAATALEPLMEDQGEEPVLLYDLGCVKQALGEGVEARRLFGRVLALGERSLRARAQVNLALLDVDELEDLCGDGAVEAGETVRGEIRDLAEVALSRLQRARELDPSLPEARDRQDVLARWLRVLEDDWSARDRGVRRDKRREKTGVTFLLALMQEQDRIRNGIVSGDPLHDLALDQRDLSADLDLVDEKLTEAQVDEELRGAVTALVDAARPVLDAAAASLAAADVPESLAHGGRARRRLLEIYGSCADTGPALQALAGAQREQVQQLAMGARLGAVLPADATSSLVESQTDLARCLGVIAGRVAALSPEAVASAFKEMATAELEKALAEMGGASAATEEDLSEAANEAGKALDRILHVASEFELQKQGAGRLARRLAQLERDLARVVVVADPLAATTSGAYDVGHRFAHQRRRLDYLQSALRAAVMEGASEEPTEEETRRLEDTLNSLEARRQDALSAHEEATAARESGGWPPAAAVAEGLDRARTALRDLWLSLGTFEETLEAAGKEQTAAVGINRGAAAAAGDDDDLFPEGLRRPPLQLADQAKEQGIVSELINRLLLRLPAELSAARGRAPEEGSADVTVEQEEARQLAEVLESMQGLLEAARDQAAEGARALDPEQAPAVVSALKAALAQARPAQEDAAALLTQALEELRRARLGLDQLSAAIMRAEGPLLPLARDLAAGVGVERGGEPLTADQLAASQDEQVGTLAGRVPAALRRTLAQMTPRGQDGEEPAEEDRARFEQARQTLTAMTDQLQAAQGRAADSLRDGALDQGRDAMTLTWTLARQIWVGFADLQGLLEEGIREQTELISRTESFQGSAEVVPEVRRDGAVTDQGRVRELVEPMMAQVEQQSEQAAADGGAPSGGLSEEVVQLAQRNLPLAREAMESAEGRLAGGRWSPARADQERARRLLEEILEKLQEDQQDGDEQQQQDQQQEQQQQDQDRSQREQDRQRRAVEERNKKMEERDKDQRKRTPVKEDW